MHQRTSKTARCVSPTEVVTLILNRLGGGTPSFLRPRSQSPLGIPRQHPLALVGGGGRHKVILVCSATDVAATAYEPHLIVSG